MSDEQVAIKTQADDWQVICSGIGGFYILIGGSWAHFTFFSRKADVAAKFRLVGTGKGLGGNITGAPFDEDDWSTIDTNGKWGLSQPFSVLDLHMTPGHCATGGVGAALAYGVMYISAGPKPIVADKPYFSVQSCGGLGLGVGVGGGTINGSWKYLGISGHRPR